MFAVTALGGETSSEAGGISQGSISNLEEGQSRRQMPYFCAWGFNHTTPWCSRLLSLLLTAPRILHLCL